MLSLSQFLNITPRFSQAIRPLVSQTLVYKIGLADAWRLGIYIYFNIHTHTVGSLLCGELFRDDDAIICYNFIHPSPRYNIILSIASFYTPHTYCPLSYLTNVYTILNYDIISVGYKHVTNILLYIYTIIM